MALTDAQKVVVAEITLETFDTIDPLVDELNSDQETTLLADLDLWADIRNSFVQVRGGKEGVDFDNERKREGIRRRVRKMLGLSLISEELSGVMELFELEVGQNFG